MNPQSSDWHHTREGMMYLSAPRRRRGEEGWEGAPRCTLDTHRHRKQAKGAGRLGPQGHWSGPKDSPAPCHGHTRYRWTERASPIRCDCDGTWQPRTSPARESAPQGEPTGVRAWEDGRSEGHSVMEWIGVAPQGQHHATRKRADVHLVFHHKRTWPTSDREKADDSSGNTDWCALH